MCHALYSGLGGKQNRHLKIVLSDGKGGIFFFPRGQDRLKMGLHINPGRPSSPRGCLPSSERGPSTRRCWRGMWVPFSGKGSQSLQVSSGSRSSYTTRRAGLSPPLRASGRAGPRGARPSARSGGRTGAASLAPTPAGSMTPHWLAGQGRGWLKRRRRASSRCKSRGEPRAELS